MKIYEIKINEDKLEIEAESPAKAVKIVVGDYYTGGAENIEWTETEWFGSNGPHAIGVWKNGVQVSEFAPETDPGIND